MKLRYAVDDRPGLRDTLVYGLQWGVMMLSSNIFLPLILGGALGFSTEMTAGFLQRTLIVLGIGSLIQIYLGHRITMFEAAAAFWISTFLIVGQEGLGAGEPLETILSKIQFLYLSTGILILLFTATGMAARLRKFFTPLVMGTTLILICLQVSGNMVRGMFLSGDGVADPRLIAFSSVLFFSVLFISFRGGRLQPLVGLAGLGGGWAVYLILGLPRGSVVSFPPFVLPELFAFGMPGPYWNLLPLSFFIMMIYLSNEITSMNACGEVLQVKITDSHIRRGAYWGGILHLVALVFSAIAMVPAAMAAGLVATTGVGARRTLAVGCVFLILLGLIGPVGAFFAAIPPAVSYSVSLAIFSRIIGIGLKNVHDAGLEERSLIIASVSLLMGAGIMFLPAGVFSGLGFLSGIFGNGLVMGMATAIGLENILFRERKLAA